MDHLQSIQLKAPAKINFGLWVTGKRDDGYHEIRTIFLKVPSLFDTLTITRSDRTEVISSRGPSGRENIAYRAIELLSRSTGQSLNVRIEIEKRIPIGAGLGGGSSDAAAVLLATVKLFALNISHDELMEIASSIGSDVPFFLLDSMAAIGRGRGEVLEPIEFNFRGRVKVEFPGIHISTGWAYSELARKGLYVPEGEAESNLNEIIEAVNANDLEKLRSLLFNSFEKVVMEAHPEILSLKNRFLKEGAVAALMSGSGSSVFGIFR